MILIKMNKNKKKIKKIISKKKILIIPIKKKTLIKSKMIKIKMKMTREGI
jgi:hypothetical protein